jgi:hypothetical protein
MGRRRSSIVALFSLGSMAGLVAMAPAPPLAHPAVHDWMQSVPPDCIKAHADASNHATGLAEDVAAAVAAARSGAPAVGVLAGLHGVTEVHQLSRAIGEIKKACPPAPDLGTAQPADRSDGRDRERGGRDRDQDNAAGERYEARERAGRMFG